MSLCAPEEVEAEKKQEEEEEEEEGDHPRVVPMWRSKRRKRRRRRRKTFDQWKKAAAKALGKKLCKIIIGSCAVIPMINHLLKI